ncbi:MAG: sensor histidine kinase [Leptolyngbyaceae cyanobacterium SL_7_1]|nr:sensor histidine kinase [Leptolyngbyaceae cyanobacterium SL_7_1]
MSQTIHPKNHPFPFLLYLEWALVAIAILAELAPTPFMRDSRYPLVLMASMAGFGLIGLRLPTGQLLPKVLYTLLEFGLIGLITAAGLRGLRLFPFLYLVMVIRSCLMFRLPGRLLVAGIAFGLFLLALMRRVSLMGIRVPPFVQERVRPFIVGFAINGVLLFGLALLFVLLLVNALLAERESRNQLTLANQQLRQYALQVENLAMVQERNRIARDIHDSLGHSLTALNLQLEGALKLWESNPDRAHAFLSEAKRLGSTTLQEVRRSVSAMRTDPLQEQSLEEAIATLCTNVQQSTGVQPSFTVDVVTPLSLEIRIALYRIVQEALTNASKHAAATAIAIALTQTPSGLELIIQDNGRGFVPQQTQTGFGLQGMRERTLALGGTFRLDSAPGKGCRIQVHIPLTM